MRSFLPSRLRSIQTLFLTVIVFLIALTSLPLLLSGVSIINGITSQFGIEILTEELNSLIEPVTLRYKTLERIGLEDSLTHRQEITENGLADMSRYRYKQSGTVFVIAKDSTLLLSSDFGDRDDPGFSSFFAQLSPVQQTIEFQAKTNKRIGVVHYYLPWDAYVGLAMDRDELFAPRDLFLRINILVLLVVLVIASFFVIAIHYVIIAPILRLTRFAEQVSSGDLQAEIPGRFILELAMVKKDIMLMVASLISREEKYRAVFDAPRDAIFIHDAETGEVLEVNKAVQEMYGYTPQQIVSKNVGDLSSGQYPYTAEEAGRRIADIGQAHHLRFEWHAKTKNNDLFWVDVSLQPFAYGSRQCVLAVVRDIDEQKTAAQALAAEKEQLAITLRSIGDGVITTDRRARVVLLNKVAEMLTGWSQQEAAGRPLEEVLKIVDATNDSSRSNPALDVLTLGCQVELPGDTVLIARDGSRKDVADSAAPIFDPDSQIVGVVLVFRDITEKQRLEQELLKIQKLESVGVLAGGIAHDFNNLLTAILGNITLSRLKIAEGSEADQLLLEAEKASLRARNLTQQLLTFSKGGEPVRQTTNMEEVIRDNAGFVLRGSSVRYSFAGPVDLWQGDIDPGQIGQVIQNIILNARQAMEKEGGRINITAKNCTNCTESEMRAEGCVHIVIEDTGPGIPPDILGKIFDPYFSTKEKGSGLGLAICHAIMKKHGGVLLVQSEPGKGTQFTLKFPVGQSALQTVSHKEVTGGSQDTLKILVMDDEEMLRNLAVQMLETFGHEVQTAAGGEEALTAYRQAQELGAPFDLVIMDLTIPGGMGGKEAVGELLALDPQAKVIVASGYSTDPVMGDYQDYGFVARLVKPFRLQDLEQILIEVR